MGNIILADIERGLKMDDNWEPTMFYLWHRFTFEERKLMATLIPSRSMGILPFMRLHKVLLAVGQQPIKRYPQPKREAIMQLHIKLHKIYVTRKI